MYLQANGVTLAMEVDSRASVTTVSESSGRRKYPMYNCNQQISTFIHMQVNP